MKTPNSLLISFLMFATFSSSSITTQAEVITFDDLPAPYAPIPNDYAGLQWQNFWYIDTNNISPSGYRNGAVSPKNVAYDFGAGTAVLSGPLFNMNSGYVTAAWNDGLQIEVQGFTDHILIYDNFYTVNTTSPILINFNFLAVDQVSFTPSGGIPHSGDFGEMFVLDNLSVTVVPEPSIFAMFGISTAFLLIIRRSQ